MTEKVSIDGFVLAYHSEHSAALFDDGADTMEVTWTVNIIPEIEEWLDKNVTGGYTVDDKFFYFEHDEDAVAFKLRWA